MNIKAFYMGEYQQTNKICSIIFEKTNKTILSDLDQIGKKIKFLNSKARERDKLKTAYGVYHVTHFGGYAYALCTDEKYPERLCFQILKNIQDFQNKGNPSKSQLQKYIKSQCEKMQDPTKTDKVQKAMKEVSLLQSDLRVGVRKIMENQEQLSDLDDHAQQLKSLASQFQVKASELQSVTWWKKWKLIFLIAAVILGIISVVMVIVLIKT